MATTLYRPLKVLPDPVRSGTWSPAARAAALHALCIPLAWIFAAAAPVDMAWQPLEALFAVLGSFFLRLAPWWILINAIFVPALSTVHAIDISPHWFLGAFAVMVLVYWGVGRTQVPLFLSSDAAARAVLALLPARPRTTFLDLGCGDARLLARLAAARKDGQFHGVEYAPLPWLAGWLRLMQRGAGCRVRWGDLWSHDLAGYDVVYAYLSPVPMPQLWEKARREMRPGSLLVSNTFAVPDVSATDTVELNDAWGGRLYVYRM